MSIKNLFTDFRNGSRNYSEYNTEKGFFKDVESIDNALALQTKKNTFIPRIDYSKPENFVKFGSAELFYEGALNKIVDYYPYDGSEAEKNNFYNSLFEGEKYIFNNLYPRFNGYAIFSPTGWGSLDSTTDDYGLPTTKEHITFNGGPHSKSNINALCISFYLLYTYIYIKCILCICCILFIHLILFILLNFVSLPSHIPK